MNKIYVSSLAHTSLIHYLEAQGNQVIKIQPCNKVYPQIQTHADIYLCSLGDMVFHGDSDQLCDRYPGDIIYNGCSTGKYFIHNLRYTDSALLEKVNKLHQILIHVRQGYTRCNCLPVDKNSVITSDEGIVKACQGKGLDVLHITPGHILLPGFDYGFIGGTGGRVKDAIVFHGNLASHPDFQRIQQFIHCRGLRLISFPEFPLTDIGSIIEEKS